MVGQTLNQYSLREKIGSGGFGEVYRAWDTRLERDVALKLLPAGALADESVRRAFRKEALALSKLNHPNIATIHDFHTCNGIDYLVMELIQGQTLAARIHAGALPEAAVAEIGAQLAAGLEEAHEHHFVHRDLKPGNVMVTAKGQVKVLDFGLAQLFRKADPDSTATIMGHGLAGTLPYMSPEQLRADTLDPRTDIYSCGVVLYEIGCGVRPFRRGSNVVIAADILNRQPERPSELNPQISPALETAILRCLAKDPAARFQTARELEQALRRLIAAPAGAPSGSGGSRPKPFAESLVVLPAKVFARPADAFLADAIPSFLSTYLNRVDGLETKVPPASVDVERLQGDLGRIAEAYNVSSLVLTLVSVEGRRATLNVQLVEASTRRLIWGGEFQGPRTRYQQLLREAADGIRKAICPSARSLSSAPGVSPAELDLLFQRGLYHSTLYVNRRRPENFTAATADFGRVLDAAPGRADAAAELARLHLARFGFVPPEEFAVPARKFALQALESDTRCGRAWSVLSALETGDYRRQLECALKGAAFGERDAFCHVQLSHVIGRSSYTLSFEASRQASRIDPLMVRAPIVQAYLASGLGRYEEAIEHAEQALRIEPDGPAVLMTKCQILIGCGRTAEAAAMLPLLDTHVAAGRGFGGMVEYVRDLIAFLNGGSEAGARLEAAATGRAPFPGWEVNTGGVPGILARGGEVEAAARVLEARNRIGLVDTYDYLLQNPWLAALRADTRFAALAAPARTGFEAMVGILRQAELLGELPGYLAQPLAGIRQNLS